MLNICTIGIGNAGNQIADSWYCDKQFAERFNQRKAYPKDSIGG